MSGRKRPSGIVGIGIANQEKSNIFMHVQITGGAPGQGDASMAGNYGSFGEENIQYSGHITNGNIRTWRMGRAGFKYYEEPDELAAAGSNYVKNGISKIKY